MAKQRRGELLGAPFSLSASTPNGTQYRRGQDHTKLSSSLPTGMSSTGTVDRRDLRREWQPGCHPLRVRSRDADRRLKKQSSASSANLFAELVCLTVLVQVRCYRVPWCNVIEWRLAPSCLMTTPPRLQTSARVSAGALEPVGRHVVMHCLVHAVQFRIEPGFGKFPVAPHRDGRNL